MPEKAQHPQGLNTPRPFDWRLGALLICVLWGATRPYVGITHDTQFYVGGALHLLAPDSYRNDLYFKYGSQDDFTVFPFLYAFFIEIMGVNFGTIVLNLIGQALWLVALWFLAASLFRDKSTIFFAMVVAILNPIRFTEIGLGEPFLTPRIFAEAMTMASVALVIRGQRSFAAAMLIASTAMHPLMTLPGLAFWLFWSARTNPKWWLAIPFGIGVCLWLALANVAPFAALLVPVDPEWLEVIRIRYPISFETERGFWPVVPHAAFLIAVLAALVLLNTFERVIALIAMFIMLAGRSINWLGTDIFPNAFIFAIQPYRAGWLFAVLGAFAIAAAGLRLAKRNGEAGKRVAVTITAMMVVFSLARWIPMMTYAGSLFALVLAIQFAIGTSNHRILPLYRWIFAIGISLAGALSILVLWNHFPISISTASDIKRLTGVVILIASLLLFVVPVLQPVGKMRATSGARGALLMSFLLVAALSWDSRSEYRKYIDQEGPRKELTALIEPNQPIYWEADLMVPWVVLRRENYFSCDQGTGTIFSRDLALEYMARYQSFEKIAPLDMGRHHRCPLSSIELNRRSVLQRNQADLTEICLGAPTLRYLALWIPAIDDPGMVWIPEIPFTNDIYGYGPRQPNHTFAKVHIYDCRALTSLRSGAGASRLRHSLQTPRLSSGI